MTRFGSTYFRLLCVTALLAWPATTRAEEHAARRHALRRALDSVTTVDLRRHIDFLAGDALEGREAGSRGGRAAGVYLEQEFRKHQLTGGGPDGGYFQEFGARYRNILGVLEGSDKELKQQVVIVGAHYDHVGYGNTANSFGPTGHIHNGADDNASGAAGVLECAEALAQLDAAPKRTILFALWDGEEKGLLGSKHWLAHPTVSLDRAPIVINMDMIGRLAGRRLHVYGTRTSPGLRRLVSEQNRAVGLPLTFPWAIDDNSDHYPFFSRGIPVVMLHTGLHDDYHRPSDDIEKIDNEGTRQVVKLLVGVVAELANGGHGARFRAASRYESPSARALAERPPPPLAGRLGVSWRQRDAGQGGIRVSHVRAGSAADRAGVQPGDRIERLAGREVIDDQQFRGAVLAAESPVDVVVRREGVEEPLTLSVELAGEPVRWGVAWRVDDAEPESIVLVRVALGSPADLAGLKVHDRVYRADGRDFTSSDAFRKIVTSVTGPLALLVERDGLLQEIVLTPAR